jgi:hypothetical protein
MRTHPHESDLALWASGDLALPARWKTAVHLRGCRECRARMEAFRLDRQRWAGAADDLPPGVQWDRLAAEMTANIRVGLAAGQCVPRPPQAPAPGWNWRPVAAVAGLLAVVGLAVVLNFPSADLRVMRNAWNRVIGGQAGVPIEEPGPVVEASADGIEFRENGSGMGVKIPGGPVAVSVSFAGSASARYVDDDTGQVAIATVYVE